MALVARVGKIFPWKIHQRAVQNLARETILTCTCAVSLPPALLTCKAFHCLNEVSVERRELSVLQSEESSMGQRGEVYSTRLVKNDRTYFFNVKENIYGDMFLNMVESKGTPESERFIRQSIIVYQEDLGEFLKELQKSLDFIKQNMKEK